MVLSIDAVYCNVPVYEDAAYLTLGLIVVRNNLTFQEILEDT